MAVSYRLLVVFLLCLPFLHAAADGNSDAERLWQLSGLEKHLAQVPSAVVAGFDSGAIAAITNQAQSAEFIREIKSTLLSSFAPDKLSAVVRATLAQELSAQEISEALQWHESFLGLKIVRLETERSSLVAPQQRQQFFLGLKEDSLRDARATLLRSLDDALKITDSSVAMMLDMQLAMSATVMNSLLGEQHFSIQELLDTYEPERKKLAVHYARESLLSMLFTYEELSSREIRAYREFAVSPSGEQFVNAVNLGLHKAMLQASYELGKALDKIIQHQKHDKVF